MKIAYGMRGPAMSESQAEAFANRNRVRGFLNHCYVSGPDADDRDTVSALKTLHDLINQGIDHLVMGTRKDTFSGGANRRRVALNLWVTKAQRDPKSIYRRWLVP